MSAKPSALNQLKSLLGQGGYIDEPEAMVPYLTSWRNSWTGRSPLIALPDSRQTVVDLVKICHAHRIAIVPQGGNTGLVGGATPSANGQEIVVNFSRLKKIGALDHQGSTIAVEPGVVLATLRDHVDQAGYLFPLSMASEGSAQIGGLTSTNAGGTAVLRYGTMRHLVLGLEVVLANGQLISDLKPLAKDNTGYDLVQYFIGAEGTLGLITAVLLKLFPKPRQSVTAFMALPHPEAALEAFNYFRSEAAEFMNAFEIISRPAINAVLKHIPATRMPLSHEHPYYLLVELSSSSSLFELRPLVEKIAEKALDKQFITDAALAENLAQAKQFWSLRENISEALRQEGPGLHFDISLPLDKIAAFLRQTPDLLGHDAEALMIAPFGHIGDGNLHYNMVIKPKMEPEAQLAFKEKIRAIVYGEVKHLNGSISAEHGIGLERKKELLAYRTPAEIGMMQNIKRILDPLALMNPGKILDPQSS